MRQDTATQCNTLQHAATQCNTMPKPFFPGAVLHVSEFLIRPHRCCCVQFKFVRVLHRHTAWFIVVQHVAGRCNVLQRVAVCCSVKGQICQSLALLQRMLQYVAVCCRVLQRVAVCCGVLQRVDSNLLDSYIVTQSGAACCSVSQCVAACSNVLSRICHRLASLQRVIQCVKACCSVLQRVAACCNVLQCVKSNQPVSYCSAMQCITVCGSAVSQIWQSREHDYTVYCCLVMVS